MSGLTGRQASSRLARFGANDLSAARSRTRWRTFVDQIRSPLLLLLVFAAAASIAIGDFVDAIMVVVIVAVSVGVGYWREYRAETAADLLRARIHARSTVVRDGREIEIASRCIVPGDIVVLSAGDLVPADAIIVEATDFFINQAILTGESYPVEKHAGAVARDADLMEHSNCVFLGTNVRSGSARCLVFATGYATRFGAIAGRFVLRARETEFDRGIREFGYLLTIVMLVLVLGVFAANVVIGRPVLSTLLFAIALAVGLSPELLPAILNVSLSHGAQTMAKRGVLVRRLSAIENLGSMDILCTDKTGTLTEGSIRLEGAFDTSGERSAKVLELAAVNATTQRGLSNPLDSAILDVHHPSPSAQKLGEIPFDFVRKRLSVIVDNRTDALLITKGAVRRVLDECVGLADGSVLNAAQRDRLLRWADERGRQGTRVLGVATRALAVKNAYGRDDERELTFEGFLTFLDAPKSGAAEAISQLGSLGVTVKMITGDTRVVAEHVAATVGMHDSRILTGRELNRLTDEALWRDAERVDLFVEVDPNQKERIIAALRRTGHVVGFLGDGVNDAPAMHAADTGLSVDTAVDVAREAADFVLLERDLDVIRRGIVEGRRLFANTLKYVLTTTSANLGNMLSMAGASLFLPFLPLTAGQILLNNFLSDIPAVGLAGDNVDHELVDRPRRWNIRFIARFMIAFGALSSLFDVMTFAALLGIFGAGVRVFRTGWFIESLLTELVIALVVRTRRPILRSRPGRVLAATTAAVVAITLAIPSLPVASILGFTPLPGVMLAVLIAITALYVAAAEMLKLRFYRAGFE